MKEKLAVLILCLASATALAQTSGNNPATSSSSSSAASTSASEDQSAAALSFTNSTGETFSVDQLAAELRSLRGTVQRTLPMLSAFNMQYSNAAAGSESIRGRLGGFLSNALKNRTSGEGTASSTSTSSLVVSNLMSRLSGALNGNEPSAPVNAQTLQRLTELQQDLQSLSPLLADLNVSTNTETTSQAEPAGSRNLAPTGRISK